MEKSRIKENKFVCEKCHYSYSFKADEIVVNEVKTVNLRAGSGKERWMRFKEKKCN
jgi:DNA-directed RNA polymerase subunit M/transcription elongation factor TFIIS